MSDKFGKIIIRANGTVANPVTVSITNIETGAAIVDGESVTTTMYSKYVPAFAAYEVSVGNLSSTVSIAEGDAKFVGDVFGVAAGVIYGFKNSLYGIGTDGVADSHTGSTMSGTLVSTDFADIVYVDANEAKVVCKKAGYYGVISMSEASSSMYTGIAPTLKAVNDEIRGTYINKAGTSKALFAVVYYGETNPFA